MNAFGTGSNHTPAPTRSESFRHIDSSDSPLFGHAAPASPLFRKRAATPPPHRAAYSDYRLNAPYGRSPTFPSLPRGQMYSQSLYHYFSDPRTAPSTYPAAAHPFLRSHKAVAAGPPIPPELADLPWGAQMYVKRVRAQQEEDERERATIARRPSFANPMTASATAPGLFSASRAPQQHQQYPQHATLAAPVTTMDPDHGGDEVRLGFGASGLPLTAPAQPPTPMAPAPTPVMIPSREHPWRGAQRW